MRREIKVSEQFQIIFTILKEINTGVGYQPFPKLVDKCTAWKYSNCIGSYILYIGKLCR